MSSKMIGVVVAYFLIYVVWGSTYFFIGVALDDFPPFLLGALRFSTAGVALMLICWFRGERVFSRQLIRHSAISGIVMLFIDMGVVMLAQRYLTSSFVAIMASSTALWIMLLDVRSWKVNFRNPSVIAGVIVGFSGVAMLYGEQLSKESISENKLRGILLLVIGCVSWALGTLHSKYYSAKCEGLNNFAGSAWQMLFASLMFWVCSVVNDDLSERDFGEVSSIGWWSLLYLIVFGSLLAYSAYVWLLKTRCATEVGTHAYVNPFIAVLLGVFVGDEQVSILQVVGLIVVLIGVVMVNRKGRW